MTEPDVLAMADRMLRWMPPEDDIPPRNRDEYTVDIAELRCAISNLQARADRIRAIAREMARLLVPAVNGEDTAWYDRKWATLAEARAAGLMDREGRDDGSA